MRYGISLSQSPHDVAVIVLLAAARPELTRAPWFEYAERAGPGLVIASDALDEAAVAALWRGGARVVALTERGDALALAPLDGNGAPSVFEGFTRRAARDLLEALRPLRLRGDPPVDEALFRIDVASHYAATTLERLLLLGHGDAGTREVSAAGGGRSLLVRVVSPPLYLLMRARDEPHEGVRAYAGAGEGVWVAWGYAHPLARSLARPDGGGHELLVDANGAHDLVDPSAASRPIYDAVTSTLEARRVTLVAAAGETRFRVRLRFAANAATEPELWLLSPAQFLALEPVIEQCTPAELGRVSVARLAGAETTTYLLREPIRPDVPRLAAQICEVTGAAGYSRGDGLDSVFFPAGRRLVPALPRDEMRSLLDVEHARLVVVDEDADGPRVVRVESMTEVPLARWVDYVATDRRMLLDRLLEQGVLSFPELTVEKRLERRADSRERPAPAPPAPRPRTRRGPEPPVAPTPVTARAPDAELAAAERARREAIRALERETSAGGCVAPSTWAALARLKASVGEHDEAAHCFEAALFYGSRGADDASLAAAAASERAAMARVPDSPEGLLEALTTHAVAARDVAFAGTRLVSHVLAGAADDALLRQAVTLFSNPSLPVPRRLAWLVTERALRRSRDALGLTRAKEALLGAMNERGLDPAVDVPGYVRRVLALDAGGDEQAGREVAASDQATLLDSLWRDAEARYVTELDVTSCYVRLTFAAGFLRSGFAARAREIVAPVEHELSVHDPTNRALFQLYLARLASAPDAANDAAWVAAARAILDALGDARQRERVEWLRRRSAWLAIGTNVEPDPWVKPQVAALLAEADADPASAARLLAPALRATSYDYEAAFVIERCVRLALRSGDDDVVAAALSLARGELAPIKILGHRVRAIGACLRAAAALDDAAAVESLFDDVVAIAGARGVPSVRDLLTAVVPGVEAVRRVGNVAAARQFFDAFRPLAARADRQGVVLRAALVEGYLQLRDEAAARETVEATLTDVESDRLDYVARYEGAAALLTALRHATVASRAGVCARIVAALPSFRDTFTTNRFYQTHQILLLEHLIDTVVDRETVPSDLLKNFLYAEEQAVRARILSDWRAARG